MTANLTIHGVKKITIEKTDKLSEFLGYVKHILIKTENGFIEISLFSNEKDDLLIKGD